MTTETDFELVITSEDWRQVLRHLHADSRRVASATLIRTVGRPATRLRVHQFRPGDQSATGTDFPPLADWLAVAAPGGEPANSHAEWLARLRPRSGQLLVVLLVGFGADRSGWRGWVAEGPRVVPLAGFRVIGPGMLRVAEPDAEDDPIRWSRVCGAVGERAFARVRDAAVGVVGCSRSGTLAAVMLAALGVRELTLIDGDRIERHNLDGMLLNTPRDIGRNKALALGRRLTAFRPDLCVRALRRPLDSTRTDPASGPLDLIVTCVDDDAPRLRAAHWAREHLTPHLDIGSGVTRGADGGRDLAADVRLLLPGAGCVRCVGGLGDLDQAEYELYAPPRALPRRPLEAWDARGRLGSLVTLNGLAVSAGVQSWLDLLDGSLAGSVWHRLRWRPGVGPEVNSALVTAAPDCPTCHPPVTVRAA